MLLLTNTTQHSMLRFKKKKRKSFCLKTENMSFFNFFFHLTAELGVQRSLTKSDVKSLISVQYSYLSKSFNLT